MDIQNQDSFELINVENFDIPSNTLNKQEEKQNNNTIYTKYLFYYSARLVDR